MVYNININNQNFLTSIYQQIISYNNFITNTIKNIVKKKKIKIIFKDNEFGLNIRYNILKRGTNSHLTLPLKIEGKNFKKFTPFISRLCKYSYSGILLIAINVETIKLNQFKKNDSKCYFINLGNIPILLRSLKCILNYAQVKKSICYGECPLDLGGYFILKGKERSILIQEIYKSSLFNFRLYKKNSVITKLFMKYYKKIFKYKIIINKSKFTLSSNLFNSEIDLIILLIALGLKEVKLYHFLNSIGVYSMELFSKINNTFRNFDKQLSKCYLKNKIDSFVKAFIFNHKKKFIDKFLENILLSEIPYLNGDFSYKIVFLIILIKKSLILLHNNTPLISGFSLSNTRYLRIGDLLKITFSSCMNKLFEFLIKSILKLSTNITKNSKINIIRILKSHNITQAIEYSLLSGIFTNKNLVVSIVCNSQVHTKFSYLSTTSMLNKINSYVNKSIKSLYPRSLFLNYWNRVCFIESPEGESCGLIKNLSYYSQISFTIDENKITSYLLTLGTRVFRNDLNLLMLSRKQFSVFHKTKIIGYHENIFWLIYTIKQLRRSFFLDKFLNYYVNEKICVINSDEGRILRPLFTLKIYKSNTIKNNYFGKTDNKTLRDLMLRGYIEFLDYDEEICTNPVPFEKNINKYTSHIEIGNFTIFGIIAGIVPFTNHNQAPRNTYHCAMEKQNIGFYGLNQFVNNSLTINILWYPQKSLVYNDISKSNKTDIIGGAQNIILSVMNFDSFNIEDSLIANKDSSFLGLFRGSSLISYRFAKINKPITEPTKITFFEFLTRKKIIKNDSEEKLGENNFLSFSSKEKRFNILRSHLANSICMITKKSDIDLKYTLNHFPEIGDKYSSRHGQKGVVGLMGNKIHFPFNLNGQIPDFIMNPAGFTSRMTMGQVLESLFTKVVLAKGNPFKSSIFESNKLYLKDCTQSLILCDTEFSGKETMINPKKGSIYNSTIFTGPIFYHKLKHLVSNKIQSRSSGRKHILTKQPVKGRGKQGGLRIGEMEKDCIIAFGCTSVLVERMLENSDSHKFILVKKSGIIDASNKKLSTTNKIYKNRISYAFKLLFQELQATNISIRIK